MSKSPKIFLDKNGQWYWERRLVEGYRTSNGGWRTDLYDRVRDDGRPMYARFVEPSGRAFRISMDALRRVTEDISTRTRGQRVFTIYSELGKVNNQQVTISFEDERTPREEEPPFSNTDNESRRKGWTSGESEWHRQTTNDVTANPELYSIDINKDPIVRRWCDSCKAIGDGRKLWLQLWTQKHPDVVFEHRSGNITVVEVEPRNTLLAGIAQLIGDYIANLDVDRKGAGLNTVVEGVLVLDESLAPEEIKRWESYMQERGCRFCTAEE